jgi:hypothetical protein
MPGSCILSSTPAFTSALYPLYLTPICLSRRDYDRAMPEIAVGLAAAGWSSQEPIDRLRNNSDDQDQDQDKDQQSLGLAARPDGGGIATSMQCRLRTLAVRAGNSTVNTGG